MLRNFPSFQEDARFEACGALLCWYQMVCAVLSGDVQTPENSIYAIFPDSGSRNLTERISHKCWREFAGTVDYLTSSGARVWKLPAPFTPAHTSQHTSQHTIAALHNTAHHCTTLQTITALYNSTSQHTTVHKISPRFICQNRFICHFLVKRLTELGRPAEIVYCLHQAATSC